MRCREKHEGEEAEEKLQLHPPRMLTKDELQETTLLLLKPVLG